MNYKDYPQLNEEEISDITPDFYYNGYVNGMCQYKGQSYYFTLYEETDQYRRRHYVLFNLRDIPPIKDVSELDAFEVIGWFEL